MRSIDLSDKTYKRLLSQTESFEDSPETVVKRLLNIVEKIDSSGNGTDEPGDVELLPEGEYWIPILEILDEFGGQRKGRDVIAILGDRLRGQLRKNDYDTLKIGEVRWSNRARFARLRMKEKGLISGKSPRGVWEMTPKGRKFLNDHKSKRSSL